MESSILVDKVHSLSMNRSPNRSRDGTTSSSAYFSTAQSFAAKKPVIIPQKPDTDREIKKSPQSPEESLYSATLYSEAKQSFTNTEDPSESLRRESSVESDVSDETSSSNGGSHGNASKPHKGNDTRWDAIQAVRSRHGGAIGLSNFKLVRKLGSGDIGSVYLAELSGTRAAFAMKVMDKAALASRKKLPRVHTEREILQALDHPFLPTLYTHFETENFSCLVIDFCPGGDLHALRQRQPGKYFSEHAARFYVAEVLLAMEYLHMLGIIYRDLKPENVLVREDGHIMLSDFDLSLRCTFSPSLSHSPNPEAGPAPLACMVPPDCVGPAACFGPRFFSRGASSKKSRHVSTATRKAGPTPELVAEPTGARSMSFVGTHEYLAPEIVRGEGHGSAVDWWTFGVFLYELLFGRTPFKGAGNRATLFNVVGQPLRFPEAPSVSFAARDLIRGLLVKEPQHRLAYRRGAAEIKQHPFFQSVNWALIRCTSPPEIPKPVVAPEIPKPATSGGNGKSSSRGEGGAVDVRTSGNYVEIDFF